MPLEGLVSLLKSHSVFRRQVQGIGTGGPPPRVSVRQGAAPAYVAALWSLRQSPTLVITPRAEDARRLHDHLLTYLGDDGPAFLLPEPEVLPFERLAVDANTSNQRLAALAALASSDHRTPGQMPPVVVASISAAMRPTLPRRVMAGMLGDSPDCNTLEVGQRVRLNDLLVQWVGLGYRNEPVVESPGAFSQRGGIIDIFPSNADLPFRVELWDDQVDTIRQFDPQSQRSVAAAERVDLVPAREQLPGIADRRRVEDLIAGMDFSRCDREVRERIEDELVTLFSAPNVESLIFYNGLLNNASLLEYLDGDGLVVLERPSQVEDEALELEERFTNMRMAREERGELPRGFPAPFFPWKDFSASLDQRPKLLLHSWLSDIEDELFQPATPYYGRLEQLAGDLRRHASRGGATVAVTRHARRLREILEQDDIGAAITDDLQPPLNAGEVHLVNGSLSEGWVLETPSGDGVSSIQLLTDSELFGTVKERRYRRPRRVEAGTEITALSDLVIGSYVVHIDHGVARFAGTTTMDEDDESKEYLVLEYAENDKLYVPTDHLDRVTAYVGAQDQPPSLTRLGSADWIRVKEKVKGAAREMAKELLDLHAQREVAQGHEFVQDTVWQQELEDSFPYEETPDQATAITEVKADMEKPKPMDRLICGDVGYGKTEVALRAAFKTVNDGMQVGLLVPTTVLAQQHYATFSDRLSPFPVSVDVLSRFRTHKEQQEVIQSLKDGSLDIVIGTHRLLQKDVEFKNLGLAVVDEEQRFGVAHKEQIKRLRQEVDVLTLSATPIPRTLNLALSGIRDLSTMDTAPEARLPIKTFVSEYSDDVVREAILREMERGGQVFFLHNRVRTIERTAAGLAGLVPQARILIGHGQMPESDLEDVMVAFSNGEADILVCTTIIESGLDLPNVNTLILDPGRPVWPVPALPATGPHRPRRAPRLRLPAGPPWPPHHRDRTASLAGHPRDLRTGGRFPHSHARPGDSRSRQPAGHRPERPHPRSRAGPLQPAIAGSHLRTPARQQPQRLLSRTARGVAPCRATPASPHTRDLHRTHALPIGGLPADGQAGRPQAGPGPPAGTPRPFRPLERRSRKPAGHRRPPRPRRRPRHRVHPPHQRRLRHPAPRPRRRRPISPPARPRLLRKRRQPATPPPHPPTGRPVANPPEPDTGEVQNVSGEGVERGWVMGYGSHYNDAT